jgi:N4-gp56 family major capsid protein
MAQTKLANIINPEVLADMIDTKLTDYMKFAPLATIDTTLQGRPGDTITLPSWNYIGDAATLAEGVSLTASVLSTTSTSATIHKIAKGIELTDEAILSGYGDPYGEAVSQLAHAIANQVDNEVLSILHGISTTMYVSTANNTTMPAPSDIVSALELFGEDIEDGPTVALVSPAVYTAMRSVVGANTWVPASEIAANIAVRGVVGEFQGCQVIVSNKLKSSAAGAGDIYLVKPGALRIFLKRDTLVEYDRDILAFTNVITASKHFVAYLYNAAKAIRIGHPA